MNMEDLLKNPRNQSLHFIGIKGTGMANLAELLFSSGALVTGSDTEEVFYTDGVLKRAGIPFSSGFSPENIPENCALVIRSAAWGEENPEVAEALRRGLDVITYPEALGLISRGRRTAAIAGVHGKTTTTAIAAHLAKAIGLDAGVIVGSEVKSLGNRGTYAGGSEFFIAETCEYKGHFLHFSPEFIVLTSVEMDHPDFFRDLAHMEELFLRFADSLPPEGALIYASDNPGASGIAQKIGEKRKDISLVPVGQNAEGPFKIHDIQKKEGKSLFRLSGSQRVFVLPFPGEHAVIDAALALVLIARLSGENQPGKALAEALSGFQGIKRRSEVLGEAGGVVFMDDYAHHPTAIATTLKGLKDFFPGRRIVASFMPHTYTRTARLFDGFVHCFKDADALILHGIYASARESNDSGVTGSRLFEAVKKERGDVHYTENPLEALSLAERLTQAGDLFITLGAGNNWELSHAFYQKLKEKDMNT